MPSMSRFAPLIATQSLVRQRLERVPEPSAITDFSDNVTQYDQVMNTKLVLAYAAALMVIHRVRPSEATNSVIDIACGPGHHTLCLAKYLGYSHVVGVDLSSPMVEIAQENSRKFGLAEQVSFQTGDATNLADFDSNSVDLSSFTDAAHHMPDLSTVHLILQEMDRVTSPSGLVMLMDLVRLKTESLTESYVNLLGQDYVERGLPAFFDDFRNSMYAAWTVPEMRSAIPTDSRRHWVHLVPRGLPSTQMILGLPVGRRQLFVRKGVPWSEGECPVPAEMQSEWRLLRTTLATASKTWIPAGS